MRVQTLWGLPRVECEAVPAGTGIVGNFRMAVLWDREASSIMASDSHADFFIRNLVAILAEMRAAFGIIRPSAFVVIDLTAEEPDPDARQPGTHAHLFTTITTINLYRNTSTTRYQRTVPQNQNKHTC